MGDFVTAEKKRRSDDAQDAVAKEEKREVKFPKLDSLTSVSVVVMSAGRLLLSSKRNMQCLIHCNS
jgi:ribosome-binding factor A